jgi:hypothetical protein
MWGSAADMTRAGVRRLHHRTRLVSSIHLSLANLYSLPVSPSTIGLPSLNQTLKHLGEDAACSQRNRGSMCMARYVLCFYQTMS